MGDAMAAMVRIDHRAAKVEGPAISHLADLFLSAILLNHYYHELFTFYCDGTPLANLGFL